MSNACAANDVDAVAVVIVIIAADTGMRNADLLGTPLDSTVLDPTTPNCVLVVVDDEDNTQLDENDKQNILFSFVMDW
jgi:hypothetical protein